MSVGVTEIIDFLSIVARWLLELGATAALAGAVASFMAVLLTWSPAKQRRQAAVAYRAQLQADIEQRQQLPRAA